MERSDWSVGQCLQTSNEASTASSIGAVDVGFRKFISSVKSAHFRKKNFEIFLSKLISNVKGAVGLVSTHDLIAVGDAAGLVATLRAAR